MSPLKISILTLFPEMFDGPFAHSIIKRAEEKGLVDIHLVNIRQFGIGRHHIVDDTPYGGGIGMVLRVDVIDKAIQSVAQKEGKQKIVLMDAGGRSYTQRIAEAYATLDHLILIAGHYEGVDQRVKDFLVDEVVSIGDYVLTGGEIPAMVISDSVTRLIPGVITDGATAHESFTNAPDGTDKHILEYPQYTKPPVYNGNPVPDILLSGNHQAVATWREHEAQTMTQKFRPDLLKE